MGGGKKGRYPAGGYSNGYSNDRGGGGQHEAQRQAQAQEREWEHEKRRDRALNVEQNERDVWDERPTFKIIPHLEDKRDQEELEGHLVDAETKFEEMEQQLQDKERMERENEDRISKINQNIDDLQKEKDQKQNDIQALIKNTSTMKQLNQTIQNKIKAIIEDKELIREQKKKKYRELGFGGKNPTGADITQAIRDVEYEMETKSNLSRRTELDLMKKIRKLQSARDGLNDQQKLQNKMQQKDEDIKLCKKEIEKLHDEKNSLSKEEASIKIEIAQISKKINSLRRELHSGPRDLIAAKSRQDDLVNLLTHKVGYRTAKVHYNKALQIWIEQKDQHIASRQSLYEEADAAREAEREERNKELAARKENPWVDEKRACQELIEYVDELCKEHVKPSKENQPEEEDEEAEETEEPEQEKEEDDVIRHHSNHIADFNLIKIQVPTSVKVLTKAGMIHLLNNIQHNKLSLSNKTQ